MAKRIFSLIILMAAVVFSTQIAISQDKNKSTAQEEVKTNRIDDLYSQVELFSYALTTIQSEYVDEKEAKDLIYGSLKGMLSSLDPHSQFLDPEEYTDLRTETQGKFGGLGIEISIRDGLLTVITPIEDTPAWRAGMKAGDRIVKIEEELTKDLTLSEAVKRLRGDPGTEINITVLREEEFKLHEFKIVREIIQIQDVKYTQVLEDKIGYLRITEFTENTHKEFDKAIDKLVTENADSLILDLRNNPGGLLNVAIKITEEFLNPGDTVVSTKGRRASQTSVSKVKNPEPRIKDWPVVVLINEGSASGSEILAGALKDNKRAVLLGTKSFGKGSVQSVIPLPDGSGLRLTTSKYFTPSGTSIHGTGIEPDISIKRIYPTEEEEKSEETAEKPKDVEEIFDDIETKISQDPQKAELLKKEKEIHERLLQDNQVQSAMSVIKGIRVYNKFEKPKS